ncbi:MAG: autotransporter outer membrane beta-barrel domain-containing protein [Oxalobacteraceae bacterium]|nr:autotransporter outer membrane beta-barrel domain-containing protein [Oxalobacteraceae bacterium]
MANTTAAAQTPPGRGITALAGLLLPAVVISISMRAEAATCTADSSPTAGCENLSLATQYINANVPSGVTVTSSGTNSPAVKIDADQNSFTNNGTLEGSNLGAQGIRLNAAVGAVTNSGVIQGYSGSAGILVNNNSGNIGSINALDNVGQIVGGSGNSGVRNLNTITTLTNRSGGSITSPDSQALYNAGTITTIDNAGTVSGDTFGINNALDATITTITNQGTLSGNTSGIHNSGTLTTLNNLQGKSSTALTYSGTLPTNYNIIISSKSSFGMLQAGAVSGTMNFDIYTGSTVSVGTYSSVLSGINASNLTATSGTFSSYPWVLNNRTGSIWDLIIGLSVTDTQTSLTTTAAEISNLLALKRSAMSIGLQYDCPIASGKRLCISNGIRSTTTNVDQVYDAGGLIVMAFRTTARTRVGMFADRSFYGKVGSGISVGYYNPMVGIFTDWKKNPAGAGLEIKFSTSYQKNPVDITRTVTGYSEPGSGTTALRSSAAQLTARYGMEFQGGLNLSPYIAVRHTRQWLNAYEENTSSSVAAPLSYSALSARSTTALVGMDVDVAISHVFHLVASGGLEADLDNNDSVIVPTSGISGLSTVSLNSTSVQRRRKASLGSYVLLPTGERVAIMAIYQQEPYAGLNTMRVTATYAAQF